MAGPVEKDLSAGLSDSLAAERTFLAWIRTGLALMGFGFVVARFGLFLQQLQVIQRARQDPCRNCPQVEGKQVHRVQGSPAERA